MSNSSFPIKDDFHVFIKTLISVSIIPFIYIIFSKKPYGEDIAVIPLVFAIIFISFYYSLISPYHVFKILLFLVVFQNFVCMFLSNFLDSFGIFTLMILKDVFAITALIVFLSVKNTKENSINKRKLNIIDVVVIGFIFLNILYLIFFHSNTLFSRLVSFKENIMLYVLYFLGRFIPFEEIHIRKSCRVLINISLFIAGFGFLERFILGDKFWITLGIHELARDQRVYELFRFENFGTEFASPMFYFVGNISLRRLASIFAQPPLTSHFLALPLLILLFSPSIFSKSRKKVYFALGLIGLAIILTIGRGGIVVVGIGILFLYIKKKLIKAIGIVLIILLLIIGVNSISSRLNLEYGIFSLQHGGGRHLIGLYQAFTSFEKPFGHGLASGGDYAYRYGTERIRDIGRWESYIGSLGYQMGIVGLILYTLICLLIFKYLYLKKQSLLPNSLEKWNNGIGVAVFGMWITSFLTSAPAGFQSSGFYFLFAGVGISLVNELKNRKNLDQVKITKSNG